MSTIKLPDIKKLALILLGALVILSVAGFFILKATLKSGTERSLEEKIYNKVMKDLDKKIAVEQGVQKQINDLVAQSNDQVKQSEARDSLLKIKQDQSNYRIKKIESEYEKINDRYRNVSKDSLRRLFAD